MTFNPFDPAQLVDPYPALAELRQKCPVSNPVPGIHLVVRHADVREILNDHERFPQAGFTPLADRDPEELGLGELDPPQHTVVRKLVLTAFGASKVRQAQSFIDAASRQLVAAFLPAGRADLVAQFAKPLPTMVVAHVMGVSEADSRDFRRLTDEVVDNLDPTQGSGDFVPVELFQYLGGLVRQHREAADPPDNLVSQMCNYVGEDGRPFTDRQIITQLMNVITGGIETTTHLIGNLFFELAQRPELYQRLRADRSLVARAIEESLRHVAPIQFLFRRCPEGAQFGDGIVPPGGTIAMSFTSANRDETVWDHPDEFDLDRGGEGHLAFGFGIHHCVGAQLARLEVNLALNAFLDAVETFQLDEGQGYERVKFVMMRGPRRLNVEFQTVTAPVAH
ncbi:MAG: cytochrome P450 [Actinomycetota bacterium]